MSDTELNDTDATDEQDTGAETGIDTEVAEARKMDLDVNIDDVGPCRKHVKVTIPQEEIDHIRDDVVGELGEQAQVPGFRVGHVPRKLLERRFKDELEGEIKQKLLLGSLQQITEDHGLDPIDEPEIELEGLEVPEEGEFTYEFKVEVSPEFELPDYAGITIDKPTREVSDEDVDAYLDRFLGQFAETVDKDGGAEVGNLVKLSAVFKHGDETLSKADEFNALVRPTLRFTDAELDGFDELIAGAKKGDTRETTVTVSSEAERIDMRGEEVQVTFSVKGVKEIKLPELDAELLERLDVESEEELRNEIRSTLLRQVEYAQRQATREQVMSKITESADWELPEKYVLKHVENALHRERLEMAQAGFSRDEIQARENELRQNAVSETRDALKEHFVLDKICKAENITVSDQELETEISIMAMQRGENPRRVYSRMVKNGTIDNLEAQIRERNAVDFILSKASFNETDMDELVSKPTVSAINVGVCGIGQSGLLNDEEAEGEAESEASGEEE